jgi:phage-related protein
MFGSISYTQTMAWEIKLYQNARGDRPVALFLATQDKKTRSKVAKAITTLEQYGPFLTPPYMKKLQANLYELRIKTSVAIRIFYSPNNNIYYLLHAFNKKTQKTPEKELKIAVDRMKELI